MDKTTLLFLQKLYEASQQNRLVIFVGAGVSANSGVPSWKDLISALKNDLPDNLKPVNDDLKIAQIYKDTKGFKDYFEKVRTVLKDGRVAPNQIHHAILQLNPIHIITTNYDDLLEQAVLAESKQYDVISQDRDLPYYRYPNKLVKMHGDFKTGNIVLSEDDYYNYSHNFPLIKAFVSSLFTTNIVLFVGFSFEDLNLKIILNDLKNLLDKDMQRVYLLTSDESLGHETLVYYEKKGINVVNISNPEEYEFAFQISPDAEKGITDIRGRTLCRQLQLIKHIETDKFDDIISKIYNTLNSFQRELNTLGDGVKYLFPSSERSYWNLYSDGLQIESRAFNDLFSQLKTHNGKREFVKLHPKAERDFLKEQALMLNVNRIDGLSILSENDHKHSGEKLAKYTTVDDFYDFDFTAVSQQIKQYSSDGLFYDKRDLLLPYLLCRIGRFYDAYLIYKERLTVFWQKELYILYFISLYNLFHIRYLIRWEAMSRTDIDGDTIVKELDAIDLESTLVRLPIPDVVKKTLADLCYNRIFTENAKEAEVLSEKVHRSRKLSEMGGASQNSHIYALKSKFWRVFTFCHRNCIEYNNSFFGLQATATISGILNSHATEDTKVADVFPTTRIDELDVIDVFIIISFLVTKELYELFKQYEIKEVKLTENALGFISKIVDNFHESSQEISPFGEKQAKELPFHVSHISYKISNILLLINKCYNSFPEDTMEKIYESLHFHRICFNSPDDIAVVTRSVKKYPPSREKAIILLQDSIELGYSMRLELLNTLSIQLAKSNYIYDGAITFDCLTRNNGELGLSMFGILDGDTRKDFLIYMFDNCHELLPYLKLMDKSQTVPVNQEKLGMLFNDYKAQNRRGTKGIFLEIIWYLLKLRKSDKFENSYAIFDSFGSNYNIYRFLMDPLNYNNTTEIEPQWIILCQDETIRELLKNNLLRQKIKEYIKTDATGKLYFEKIYDFL